MDSTDVTGVTGAYFHSEEEAQPSEPEALTPAYRRRLATLTQDLLAAAGV
ncbi:hypothetical protein ACFY8O_34215 [Streptomyces argenteolus]|uniref:Uncharacterized protein n=1 Tax=Streptomyces argenteolus TaxID=67274 RepID=A0ABW6XGQ6_9ACTN